VQRDVGGRVCVCVEAHTRVCIGVRVWIEGGCVFGHSVDTVTTTATRSVDCNAVTKTSTRNLNFFRYLSRAHTITITTTICRYDTRIWVRCIITYTLTHTTRARRRHRRRANATDAAAASRSLGGGGDARARARATPLLLSCARLDAASPHSLIPFAAHPPLTHSHSFDVARVVYVPYLYTLFSSLLSLAQHSLSYSFRACTHAHTHTHITTHTVFYLFILYSLSSASHSSPHLFAHRTRSPLSLSHSFLIANIRIYIYILYTLSQSSRVCVIFFRILTKTLPYPLPSILRYTHTNTHTHTRTSPPTVYRR